MSKEDDENVNVTKTYTTLVNNFINGEFKGITPQTEKRSDGTTKIHYQKSDGKYLTIIKNQDGKVTNINYATKNTSTVQTLHTITDSDGDGQIDAGEQKVRHDIKLIG